MLNICVERNDGDFLLLNIGLNFMQIILHVSVLIRNNEYLSGIKMNNGCRYSRYNKYSRIIGYES